MDTRINSLPRVPVTATGVAAGAATRTPTGVAGGTGKGQAGPVRAAALAPQATATAPLQVHPATAESAARSPSMPGTGTLLNTTA